MLQLTNGPWQHQILWPANVAVQCKLTDRYVHFNFTIACPERYARAKDRVEPVT